MSNVIMYVTAVGRKSDALRKLRIFVRGLYRQLLTQPVEEGIVKTCYDGEVDPCTPTALVAYQPEGEGDKSILQYEVATAGNCTTEPNCAGFFIRIRKCHENGGIPFKPQMKGRFCAYDTGCYEVVCGNITSNNVTLLGISDIRVKVKKPVFRNSKLVEISVTSKDSRVTGFKFDIRDNATRERLSGDEIQDPTTSLEVKIDGNFTSGKCYRFTFNPIVNATGCKVPVAEYAVACYNATDTTEIGVKTETRSLRSSTVTLLTVCLLIFAVVCLAVSVAISRRKKAGIEQRGKPGGRTLRANRVLVVHASDDLKLQEKCTELCFAISAHLGDSRKVQDIYLTKDSSLFHDPQAWVTNKVIATRTDEGEEQGRTIIVLVLSPLLVKLQRALAEEKEELDFFGRQPHPHDPALKTFLRHLATPALKMDHQRLLLVRFSALHEHWSGDLHDLVPGKRFVLPHHENQLLEAIE
ncbi:uncharacterized protein LOC119599106 [Penaeus monodon]|uniref:uncharacterized protein LOC119599106 n=1 Tax=Penaeus monodon TaxID=6687 RepID=UPI0018A799D8|nr:uncharacterized protein LOC119599106 [Penaeus monodon]